MRCSGIAYKRSPQGYYKPHYIVLTNTDLYFYNNVECTDHSEFQTLVPAVFVRALPAFVDVEQREQRKFRSKSLKERSKLYPIEISFIDPPTTQKGLTYEKQFGID